MLDLKIPLQPKQAELYDIYENSPCTRIGAGGSRGGAKSHAARSIMLLRRLKYPRTRGMIFRRKRKDLWDNHIQPYFAQWPILQSWYTKQENEIRLPNGSAICFRYAEYEKDVDDFLGPDFMDIMIDEATQVSEITIQKFFGCNRWPALPGVRA
jgi:phage terminase large subunit